MNFAIGTDSLIEPQACHSTINRNAEASSQCVGRAELIADAGELLVERSNQTANGMTFKLHFLNAVSSRSQGLRDEYASHCDTYSIAMN